MNRWPPSSTITQRYIKPVGFLLGTFPLLGWIIQALTNQLSADPIQQLLQETGLWTLRLLLITLAITPLKKLISWPALANLRRMLGLFSFFYACLHVLLYLIFDQSLEITAILHDIIQRPFITVGFISFLLMIPLAVTSNRRMIHRLGMRRWKNLHKLNYLIAIGGVVHFYWLAQSKADVFEPFVYAIILATLFLLRYSRLVKYTG